MTRILVVDDEKEIAELVEAILSGEGFEVRTVQSGREALASINARPLHLVLLDVMMPDIDGCAVFRTLKADTKTRNIPIVLMSASDRLSDIAADLKPEGSLPKPFSIESLIDCVTRHALT